MAARRFLQSILPGAALALSLAAATASAQVPDLSVRITSPLGRTGLPGPVRIVAQVSHDAQAAPGPVSFFVDGHLLGAVDAAPYALEWVDDNPFERRQIEVRALDSLGHEAHDSVVLEPFEVTEAAQVASVVLDVGVEDKTGRSVRGLPPSAFSVREDGVPQVLDLVRQEAVGATFALLVDSSASMSRRIDFVQRTAASLAGYMGPGDLMLVAPFSKTIGATTGPTDDRRTILEAIGAIQPTGGTAILDAITRIGPALATAKGRRAIVLITDGYDEQSTATIDDAIAAVKAADATVYVIGIGGVAGISLKGERLLKRLAAETGGKCFLPSKARELASVRDRLTDDVQHRYLVTYTPSNQAVDGTWRTLSVSTAVPGATVRTRNGYFAPRPAPIRPMLEFTAIDGAGRYVNLTADDLEILEDGEPQDVQIFQDAVEPVSIVLALDASGSMRRKEPDVIRSAQGFVDALRPEDRLAVVTFSDTPVFAHDLSTTREFSRAAIEKYSAAGGTALYDAMADGLLRLKHTEGRRVVVVMTDGRDENNPGTGPGSVHTLADVLKLQKESGAMIFTIGLGTKVDHQVLTQFANVSGGRALFPLDVQALDTEYRRVIEDLRRRYVVGFTSTHTKHDGAWRDVQIRVKSDPEATIRGAGGYFAPNK